MEITYLFEGERYLTESSDERIRIDDHQENGRRCITVTALKDLELTGASLRMAHSFYEDDLIFANGYQSWTETKEFVRHEYVSDLKRTGRLVEKRFHFKQYGSQAFWPMEKAVYLGFDFSYVRGKSPIFIGSYNYRNAYLLIRFYVLKHMISLESDVEGRRLQAGETFTVFDFVTDRTGDAYFSAFTPRPAKKLLGYTSWYNHYQNIREELIESALEKTDDRFDLFQIDDGFETFVGDWLDVDPVKFPRGLEPIVSSIHEKGMLAGIWLAPFVAEDQSRLMKEHPEWIAKDDAGQKIYAGCNWSGDCPLDLNVPEAVDYIREVLRHYVSLGFDFFKLDFLYAVNLKPLKGKTRCETAEFAYRLLREELEGKLVLACGATLSNCFERFEYCRIGPDVSLDFDDVFYMRWFHPERISTRVTLGNTIFRSMLDGRVFANDPDVFLLRDENIRLSRAQKESLTLLNGLYGSLMMTSDDIAGYDADKKALLEQALTLFREATPLSAERSGDLVRILYRQGDAQKSFLYDLAKGVIKETR